jgi:hypothetical protein
MSDGEALLVVRCESRIVEGFCSTRFLANDITVPQMDRVLRKETGSLWANPPSASYGLRCYELSLMPSQLAYGVPHNVGEFAHEATP